ncbi:MAG: PKD domain-containing protein, partial [Nanoarchaeota archaeon]
MADRESKVIGLRFSGGELGADIKDFSISINSDAPESTFKQLFIDAGDDGIFEWISEMPSGNFYNEDYGCFDFTGSKLNIAAPAVYCEKINVPIAPEVEIGANVVRITETPVSATFTFTITPVDETNKKTANCDATTLSGGRIGCVPGNFKIDKQQDYYICIKPKTSGDNDKYRILSETAGDVCGYSTEKKFPKDFDIFAKPGKFEAVGDLEFNSEEKVGKNIEKTIEDYISEKYGNDCSDECIVPIRFTAGKISNQEITISTVGARYTLDGVSYPETEYFPIYDVEKTPATISSDFVQLNLNDAEFSLPAKIGSNQFKLSLNGTEIFSEAIKVEPVPKIISLNPTVVAAALPTEFFVKVELFGNGTRITKYKWSFDGEIQETTEEFAIYAFDEIGPYAVDITITDSTGKTSTKSFTVQAASPKDAVNMLLARNINSLNGIKTTLESLNPFDRNSLTEILTLDEAETIIGDLQQANATAISDDDYISIMGDL